MNRTDHIKQECFNENKKLEHLNPKTIKNELYRQVQSVKLDKKILNSPDKKVHRFKNSTLNLEEIDIDTKGTHRHLEANTLSTLCTQAKTLTNN